MSTRPNFYRRDAKAQRKANAVLDMDAERTCVHCGCTDSNACAGGCGWAIKHQATLTGVCSQCVPKEIKPVDAL
jgi:hypothetical protein